MDTIYLDHNATTPVRPEVIEEIARCMGLGLGNPASAHGPGREARRLLEEARRGVAEILGANLDSPRPDRVIFTSGGTESNNLAVLGIARRSTAGRDTPGHVVVSSLEHSSVVEPVERLMDEGWDVDALPAAPNGRLRHELLAGLLRDDTCLVTATMANHETGVLQPIGELADVCNGTASGGTTVPLHADAAQLAGKMPINFREMGLAAITISAHKFGGPPGVGALVIRHGLKLDPLLFGGGQQESIRPGTESVALARGLWTALRLADEEQQSCAKRLNDLRCHFEAALERLLPNIEVHGAAAARLPNTTSVGFPNQDDRRPDNRHPDARRLVESLDRAGIACSVGSACTSGSDAPSPTLLAMGVPTELARSSLRFSLGRTTTREEIDAAIERIVEAVKNTT